MKEIEYKIIDSVFGEFNQELIGDKVKLQNKVNKLQRMIDMINYFQPIEKEVEEKKEFVLPNKWAVKDCEEVSKYSSERFYCKNIVSDDGWFLNVNEYRGICNFSSGIYQGYTEITLEQFKKYVLNK